MSMKIPRRMVQRVCVWFSMRLGKTAKDTLANMETVFGETSYKKSAVYKWHASFRSGRTKLGDLLHPGAPQRARTRRCIRQCRVLVENNRRIRVDQLSRTLGISHGSTLRVLHKDLGLKKRSAKLVPHQLTEEHKRKRREFCQDFLRRARLQRNFLSSVMTTDEAWFYMMEMRTKEENKQWLPPGADRPQVPRRPRNCKKLLIIPFFDRHGLVHIECLQNQTVKGRTFLLMLQRVQESLFLRRLPVRRNPARALLHMDNTPAHRSCPVQDWLTAVEWRQVPHLPYSPDLSPCDFFLFPLLKRKLRGCNYGDIPRLSAAVYQELSQITQLQWKLCFADRLKRCRKCLQFRGGYFEGMKHPLPPP